MRVDRTMQAASPGTKTQQLIFGRDPSADIVLDHGTISGRHARLAIVLEGLMLEDLGSTNGTWLRGERVSRVLVQPGDEVLLGGLLLPWGDARVHTFVRRGSGTMEMPAQRPAQPKPRAPSRDRGVLSAALSLLATIVVGVGVSFALWRMTRVASPEATQERIVVAAQDAGTTRSEMEAAIRAQRVPGIIAAIDSSEPLTRNTAVKMASQSPGTFNLAQVANIWTHARSRWHYVNDPRGQEYFARASETITNDYAGDCDDFAIVLAAMLGAIGGEARIVLMSGPGGGHAYTEICVEGTPEDVARDLSTHYRRHPDPFVGRARITEVHFRSDASCGVWLNLDWNARVPGGAYESETWAVAIFPDGNTATLAPAPATAPDAGTRDASTRAAARPR